MSSSVAPLICMSPIYAPDPEPEHEFYNVDKTDKNNLFLASFKPLLGFTNKEEFVSDFKSELNGTDKHLADFGLIPGNQPSWQEMLSGDLDGIGKVIGSLEQVNNLLNEFAETENLEGLAKYGWYDLLTVFCLAGSLEKIEEIPPEITDQLKTKFQNKFDPLFSPIMQGLNAEEVDVENINELLGALKQGLLDEFGAIPQDIELVLSGEGTNEEKKTVVSYLKDNYLDDKIKMLVDAGNQEINPKIKDVYDFVIKKAIRPALNVVAGNIGIQAVNTARRVSYKQQKKNAIEREKENKKMLQKSSKKREANRKNRPEKASKKKKEEI